MKVMNHCANCKYSRNVGSYLACYGQKNAPKVNWFDVCEDWKPKSITNADRIRSMTDEEIAKIISEGCCRDFDCPNEFQKNYEFQDCYGCWLDCYGCWLDWLRDEVNDE